VFIVLNVIENVIHYNIGKFHEGNGEKKKENDHRTNIGGYHFTNPSNTDWVRIVVIMVIFAILQGFFTSYFSVC
jgi:murein L,D-transpeptidase YafK